ncbi:hypothetical protein PAAG_12133 [Paracoccidioides lutzii Pb01]|uniref:Uncharacterized protein n=1 Tax=Paracoccidioides lutzii (strain ATCC MYA-826 / Pb01) TaxID=502779 RepID=A0A0A2V148_PARBA|nr:hypothetical protein PAAG_12133 [Paracoccidioides lutzii Pb01]KGQ01188.1 hypothetical protein PAAG_12133 [Paracoccidioides lutzii Pb01]
MLSAPSRKAEHRLSLHIKAPGQSPNIRDGVVEDIKTTGNEKLQSKPNQLAGKWLDGSINALPNCVKYYGLPPTGKAGTGIVFAIFNIHERDLLPLQQKHLHWLPFLK